MARKGKITTVVRVLSKANDYGSAPNDKGMGPTIAYSTANDIRSITKESASKVLATADALAGGPANMEPYQRVICAQLASVKTDVEGLVRDAIVRGNLVKFLDDNFGSVIVKTTSYLDDVVCAEEDEELSLIEYTRKKLRLDDPPAIRYEDFSRDVHIGSILVQWLHYYSTGGATPTTLDVDDFTANFLRSRPLLNVDRNTLRDLLVKHMHNLVAQAQTVGVAPVFDRLSHNTRNEKFAATLGTLAPQMLELLQHAGDMAPRTLLEFENFVLEEKNVGFLQGALSARRSAPQPAVSRDNFVSNQRHSGASQGGRYSNTAAAQPARVASGGQDQRPGTSRPGQQARGPEQAKPPPARIVNAITTAPVPYAAKAAGQPERACKSLGKGPFCKGCGVKHARHDHRYSTEDPRWIANLGAPVAKVPNGDN